MTPNFPAALDRTSGALAPVLVSEKSFLSVFADLIKVRLTSLVLLTTLVGFYMGNLGVLDPILLLHTVMGTALVACGASALNQFWEREQDAKMQRTQDRPLPSGRLQPKGVLGFGLICSALGLIQLVLFVNALTFCVGAVTLGIYIFVYTPLKRLTWLNTIVGAVPGGLPPLMGWTAAQNELGLGGVGLFAILFFWQISHFLAIAWMYREEYAKAGFVMLPNVDADGLRTARLTIANTLGLLGISLLPVLNDCAGGIYLSGALVLGLSFFGFAVQFGRKLTLPHARRAFLVSIIYLPLLLGLLVLDKIKQ